MLYEVLQQTQPVLDSIPHHLTVVNLDSVYYALPDSIVHHVKMLESGTEKSFWSEFGGFLVLIIVALISGIIALYQAKSNVISAARIKWIEEVKSSVSLVATNAGKAQLSYTNYLHFVEIGQEEKADYHYDKYLESLDQLNEYSHQLTILLNLDKEEHAAILLKRSSMSEYLSGDNIEDADSDVLAKDCNELSALTSKLIKDEWKKSKRLWRI